MMAHLIRRAPYMCLKHTFLRFTQLQYFDRSKSVSQCDKFGILWNLRLCLRGGDFCIHSLDRRILLSVSQLGIVGVGLKFRSCFSLSFSIYMIPPAFDTERLKCRHLTMNLRSRRLRGSFWRFSCAFVVDVQTGCQQLVESNCFTKTRYSVALPNQVGLQVLPSVTNHLTRETKDDGLGRIDVAAKLV